MLTTKHPPRGFREAPAITRLLEHHGIYGKTAYVPDRHAIEVARHFPPPMSDDEIRLLVAGMAARERVHGQAAVRRQANRVRAELGMPSVERENLQRAVASLADIGRRIRAAFGGAS